MYQMSLPFMAGNQAPVMLHAENSEPSLPTPDMHTFFSTSMQTPFYISIWRGMEEEQTENSRSVVYYSFKPPSFPFPLPAPLPPKVSTFGLHKFLLPNSPKSWLTQFYSFTSAGVYQLMSFLASRLHSHSAKTSGCNMNLLFIHLWTGI